METMFNDRRFWVVQSGVLNFTIGAATGQLGWAAWQSGLLTLALAGVSALIYVLLWGGR